jgi:hypothetical protein
MKMTEYPKRISISPVYRQKRDDDFYLVDRDAFPGKGKEYVPADLLKAERARADRLEEALRRIDEASNHYAMTPTYSEGTLRYAHQSTRNLARAALGDEVDT